MRSLSLALAILVVCWSKAYAVCTTLTCTRAVVFPAGGSVPADHLRLLYYPSGAIPLDVTDDASVMFPRLYRLEGTTKVNVQYEISYESTFGIWLTPTIEQPLGTQLVLETDRSSCDVDAPLNATYTITEKRPTLPSTLGTLSATTNRALIPVAVGDGLCSEVQDVSYADVRINLSQEALPFAALWRYQLYVDDQTYAGFLDTSSANYRLPQGSERLYAQCGDMDAGAQGATAIAPGVHTVHFAAQLGDEQPLVTPDIQIELLCDGSAPSGPIDGGVSEVASKVSGSCALYHGDASWLALLALAMLVRQRRAKVA